jgi:hypothetical protein
MTRRSTARLAWLLLSALCLLAHGCTRTINRSAERKIRDVLPSYIGPARVWRAHVENPPERTIRGRLSSVTIDGEQVQLRDTILLDTLHIEMRDAEFDAGLKRLKSVGETTFRAVVSEQSLNDFLRRNPPPEEEPVRIKHVYLRQGHFYVEATRWLVGRAWAFTSTTEPRLASPTRLDFAPERMTFLGLRVPLPASALQWFARRLDQGFDFTTLPFPVRISRFTVEPGRITIEGTADVMRSLNQQIGRVLEGSPASPQDSPRTSTWAP